MADVNHYEGHLLLALYLLFGLLTRRASYRIAKSKSIVRIGGINILNHYARTGMAALMLARLYYVSYGYNIFLRKNNDQKENVSLMRDVSF
jgi:hypothetical protein